MKLLLLLFFVCNICYCVKLPSNFKKCNRKDPDLKKCVFNAAQHGFSQLNRAYKSLGIPSLEPLEVAEFAIKSRLNLVRMDEKLHSCRLYNLTDLKLQKFDFDLDAKNISVIALFREVHSTCRYHLNGTIIGAPIFGEGFSALVFSKFNVSVEANYIEVKRRNKTYAKFYDVRVKGRPQKVHFRVDNLFNGDQEATVLTNKVLNDVWSELYDDASEEYLKLADQLLMILLNRLFSKLSIEEAFD